MLFGKVYVSFDRFYKNLGLEILRKSVVRKGFCDTVKLWSYLYIILGLDVFGDKYINRSCIFFLVKWCYFIFFNVKFDFLCYLFKRVRSVVFNGVKECRYFKLLIWKEKVLRMLFKIYNLEDV